MNLGKYKKLAKTVDFAMLTLDDVDGYGATVAWFSNIHNPAGWIITELSMHDYAFLRTQGFSTDEIRKIYRTISDKGNTSLAVFDLMKGTYAFADNEKLVNSDKLTFQPKTKIRMMRINRTALGQSMIDYAIR